MCSQQLNGWLWKVLLLGKSEKNPGAWHRVVVIRWEWFIVVCTGSGEMNGVCRRAGDEVAWSGEPNGSSRDRQAWTWSKRGHDYEPQRERRQCKSHTDNQQTHTHTHTPAVDEDDGKQVIDQAKPDTNKKGLAATPKHKVRHEGRGSTRRQKECCETECVSVRGVLLDTHWKRCWATVVCVSVVIFTLAWRAQSPLIREHSHETHHGLCCNQIQRPFTYGQIYENFPFFPV